MGGVVGEALERYEEQEPNHVINPITGFLESPGYAYDFDSARKLLFLDLFKKNGLGLYRTCDKIGLSVHTVNKHLRRDPVFKKAYDDAMVEYADELEAVSRENALNPRSVIERIFQLKSLLPSKYADQRVASAPQISITIDGKVLSTLAKRAEVIEAQEIKADATDVAAPERPL